LAILFSPLKRLVNQEFVVLKDRVEFFSHRAYACRAVKFGLQLSLASCFCALALGMMARGDSPPTADNSSSFTQMSSLTNIDINPPPSSDSGFFKSSTSLSEAAAAEDPLPTSNIPQPRRQLSPDQIAALLEKNEKESNWLIYGYQEALRRNSTSHEADNFYLQDAFDKDPANSSDTTYHTGAANTGKNAVTLRDDPSSKPDGKKDKMSFFSDKAFKPFLAPLSSSEVMSVNNSSGGSFFPVPT
jgi:hypothetical protein